MLVVKRYRAYFFAGFNGKTTIRGRPGHPTHLLTRWLSRKDLDSTIARLKGKIIQGLV
jgi:hypothetical protein